MIEVHVRGLEELQNNFKALSKNVAKNVLRRSVRRAARTFANAARFYLSQHVDTGLTRRSVVVQARRQRDPKNARASIGVTNGKWNYRRISVRTQRPIKGQIPPSVRARLLEYGYDANGRHVAASPWLRPAFDRAGNAALKEAVDELRAGVLLECQKLPKGGAVRWQF